MRERKSETEKENDGERLLDEGEWSLLETEMNPDQRRIDSRRQRKGTK